MRPWRGRYQRPFCRNSVVVATGAWVLVKLAPVILLSPVATGMVVVIGSVSALGGSLIAAAQIDIKRVMSYLASAYMGLIFCSGWVSSARDGANVGAHTCDRNCATAHGRWIFDFKRGHAGLNANGRAVEPSSDHRTFFFSGGLQGWWRYRRLAGFGHC